MLPFQSLNAVTAAQSGQSLDLGGVACRFTLQAIVTGGGSATLVVEGSLDGTNWYEISPQNLSGFGSASFMTFGDNPYFAVDTGVGSNWRFAHYVRFVRANLTVLTGGSSPTVTAWIAVGDPPC